VDGAAPVAPEAKSESINIQYSILSVGTVSWCFELFIYFNNFLASVSGQNNNNQKMMPR
jgi:hypothetical protein